MKDSEAGTSSERKEIFGFSIFVLTNLPTRHPGKDAGRTFYTETGRPPGGEQEFGRQPVCFWKREIYNRCRKPSLKPGKVWKTRTRKEGRVLCDDRY